MLGSFTAAARSLGYSQPAISRQVAAMEAAAGDTLFVRNARGVSLSPAGAAVVTHASRILAGVLALHDELDTLSDRLAGRIRMGAFPIAMAVLVPRALAKLGLDHPGLVVTLTEAATPALVRELRAGRLAAAVIGAGAGLPDYDLEGVQRHLLSAGDLCVAVPVGHRLAEAPTIPVTALAGESWIVGAGPAGDPQFGAWPTLSDPVVKYRVRGWPARLGLVAAELGICVMPQLAALSIPAGVTTVRVEDPIWSGRVTMAITLPDPPAGVSAIIDALRHVADDIRTNP